MSEIFSTIRLMVIVAGGLFFAFLVLLGLPESRLREIVMPFVGWGVAALSVAYIVSPIDGIPDIVPVIGWADDLVALAVAVGSAMSASASWKRLKQLD